MHHRIHVNGRRAFGWASLAGAGLVCLFWIVYFGTGAGLGRDDGVVRGFESAFPVADGILALVLAAAGRSLLRGADSGPFLLVAGAAMSLYLGVLDVTFYARRGLYRPVSAGALLELVANALCIGGGAAALWWGWRLWRRA